MPEESKPPEKKHKLTAAESEAIFNRLAAGCYFLIIIIEYKYYSNQRRYILLIYIIIIFKAIQNEMIRTRQIINQTRK